MTRLSIIFQFHLAGSPSAGLTVKAIGAPIFAPPFGETSKTLPPNPPRVTTHSSGALTRE